MAEYILMHKNIPVIKMELTEADGITKILDLYAPEHLPIGIPVKKNTVDKKALNMWWADRSIPSSRSGVQEALNEIGLADTKMLLVRSFGLSLSDQYWIKPDGTDLEWKRINFFDNAFSDDIGNVLFGLKKREGNFDFSSPDNTSDGCLKKRWKIIDGRRCLLKGGSKALHDDLTAVLCHIFLTRNRAHIHRKTRLLLLLQSAHIHRLSLILLRFSYLKFLMK